MKNFVISSGSFSSNGNYSGRCAKALGLADKSGRIFIPKQQMESLGWTKDSDVKFPFVVLASEREYNKRDAQGALTDEKFTRLTSFAAYKTAEELTAVQVMEATLDINVNKAVKEAATAAGLSEAAITDLLQLA